MFSFIFIYLVYKVDNGHYSPIPTLSPTSSCFLLRHDTNVIFTFWSKLSLNGKQKSLIPIKTCDSFPYITSDFDILFLLNKLIKNLVRKLVKKQKSALFHLYIDHFCNFVLHDDYFVNLSNKVNILVRVFPKSSKVLD